MADNVNIIVQDTINDIVVNAAVVVETIDINVQAAVDVVDIVANPNNYVVNINRIIGEQVQSDWTQTDNQAPDYIKNKPTIPTATSDLTNDGEDGINPFITAADVTPQVNSDWDATSGVAEILNKPTIPAAVTKTSDLTNDGENGVDPFITAADVPASVTSVGLTMPSAFSVANSPITSAGTLEVTGAGVVSQYVRGDGSLANFPTSTGGGASLSFYLNGSVSQGTIGGVAFREMDRTPILGAGTDFTINANGYIQSFITDANVPNLLEIPAGNWNFETYFSASSGGGSPRFYIELYKWNGTTLSLIASNSATPEGITNGTAIDLYVSALAVPQTTLLATDRLAVRFYVIHSGRTITMHTEDNHLCQVITTFSTGLTALNGLTTQVQSFATGTSGTDFGISSATATHTFNLPTASAANRGALSSTDWSTFNGKFTLPTLTSGSVLFSNGTTIAQNNTNFFWNNSSIGLCLGGTTLDSNFIFQINGSKGARISGTGAGYGYSLVRGSETSSFANSGSGSGLSSTTTLLFNTAATERMRVNSSGNVLINTTTDAGYRLDVNGTARVSGNATFGTLGTGTGMFWDDTNNRLGIGTNAPAYNLDILSGATPIFRIKRGTTTELRFSCFSGGGYIGTYNNSPLIFTTNSTDRATIFANGNFAIGTTTDIASSKLTIESTTQGFLPPRMTTTQKNAIVTPAAGLVVYDTTLGKLCVRTAAAWETITSI